MKHIPILLLSAALLAASPLSPILPNACAQPTAKEKVPEPKESEVYVFVPGAGNEYRSICNPTLINADGVLVAVAEGYYDHKAYHERNDMIVSTSADGGRTWSKPTVAAATEEGTFNNPCLIYDEEAHRIVLFFQYYPVGVHESDKNVPTGHKDKRCIRNFVCFSIRGKTWSRPQDVTKFTKNEGVTITSSSSSPGVQIKRGKYKGRLVIPLNEASSGDWTVAAAYSDDHGKTWDIGLNAAVGKGIKDASIAETDDGDLIAISRALSGNQRKIACSQDGGDSWEEIPSHPRLPSIEAPSSLVRYSFEDDDQLGNQSRLIIASPTKIYVSSQSKCPIDGVVKMSYDNGKTWKVEKKITPNGFDCPSLTPISPGIMGILYSDRNTSFTTFSIDWLTNGKDSGVGEGVKIRKHKQTKEEKAAEREEKKRKSSRRRKHRSWSKH